MSPVPAEPALPGGSGFYSAPIQYVAFCCPLLAAVGLDKTSRFGLVVSIFF